MPEILAISGSLRFASSNTALLKAAALLAQAPTVLRLYNGLADIPHFNPDLDIPPYPEAVTRFRDEVRDAHAVIFSTPEYAHGIPGVLKNALDWLVGSGELYGKPVTLFNASDRGIFAQSALQEVLKTMGTRYVSEAEVTVSIPRKPLDNNTSLLDTEAKSRIEAALQTLTH